MTLHRKALRALAALAGQYADRWPELCELEPEDLCAFLVAQGWVWNPHTGLLGRWERSPTTESEESHDPKDT
jgi:hypothetical protein